MSRAQLSRHSSSSRFAPFVPFTLAALGLALFTYGCSSAAVSPTSPVAEPTQGAAEEPASLEELGADVLPFQATETTLANGLKVIVVPTGFPNLVSLQIPVQTGSRNEVEAGKTGFAHFFEHMMFRGTAKYPPAAYEAIITKAGARQNAYTTDDYTNYHVTFAKEDLEQILEIEADRFMNLSYSEAAFRTEALAVLGEYNKNAANPFRKLFEVMRNEAYSTHTYKHTTMGFIEDIEAMPDQIDYAKVFFDRFYRPEYTTVMVVGDVKPSEVLPLVEKYWGVWERGSFRSEVPKEPAAKGPLYVHVPWASEVQPIVSVNFHGPAFSESEPDAAALELVQELHFGETSELYRRLVVQEQKVDLLGYISADSQDPSLTMILARLKDPADALYVRDAILATVEEARTQPVKERRLIDAKTNLRYGFASTLDNSETIASNLARYVRFRRSYGTLNNVFRLYDGLTVDDLLRAAQRYFTDERLVLSTLSQGDLQPEVAQIPPLASFTRDAGDGGVGGDIAFLIQGNPNPQLSMRLLFEVGSVDDPKGKEGLATLAASMIAEAGSREMRYEEIQKTLFPVAGSLGAQVDKEMTVFVGAIHKDNLEVWTDTALPQLVRPGFREEDFERLKENQRIALIQDLRANNEEELGKEVLQAKLFTGTRYAHPPLGTLAGLDAITLADVEDFVTKEYTRSRLVVGLAGDVPSEFEELLRSELSVLQPGDTPMGGRGPAARKPRGIEVDIVEKKTRATAISLGFPIEVTRSHPDFVALYLARTWLGEHRSSMSHLYQRIRELRGMNYGDYAYIEAFPRGMFQFFPDANIARRAQIFEIWIRPVKPEQAHHALRIALYELKALVEDGLTQEEFEATREYLSKNVFLMTSTQSQQLGYALDSRFYGIGEYTSYMRDGLAELTLEDVNAALRQHLTPRDVSVVFITEDAEGLKQALLADEPSSITYESEKPKELLDEDRMIGERKLDIRPEALRITPVADVFAE